jgi:hypothetical protein
VEPELEDTPLRDLQEARVTLLLALSANPESAPVLHVDAMLKAAASMRLAGIQRCYTEEEDLVSVDTHLEELRALERFWGAESTYLLHTAPHSTEIDHAALSLKKHKI